MSSRRNLCQRNAPKDRSAGHVPVPAASSVGVVPVAKERKALFCRETDRFRWRAFCAPLPKRWVSFKDVFERKTLLYIEHDKP